MGESDRLRVLLVVGSASQTDDSALQVADLLHRLPDAGAEVSLACPPAGARGTLAELATSAGVRVFAVDIPTGFAVSRAGDLRSAVAASKPDVVHAFGSRAAMIARLADPRARERVVYSVQGMHVHRIGPRARRAALLRIEHRLRSRSAAWICECGSDLDRAEHLKLLRRERSHVVYKGVEILGADASSAEPSVRLAFRRELELADSTPLALSIGAFDEQRDQRTLLDAWASARAAAPGAVLALVGSGDLEARLRERAFALSLGDSVRFVAPRPDVASLYAAADLFVLSSRWEGLPYVVLEAMAHALPVVSTAVDGIPEAVINEDTGLLGPAHDVGSLASAIRHLLADSELRRAMGEAGRERAERHFTLEEMVDGVVRVYREVVSAGIARG